MPSEPKPLSPNLQAYIDALAAADRPLTFSELMDVTPHYNGFRHLKARGLIRDVSVPYRNDEPWTGPRPSLFVLTEEGRRYVKQ